MTATVWHTRSVTIYTLQYFAFGLWCSVQHSSIYADARFISSQHARLLKIYSYHSYIMGFMLPIDDGSCWCVITIELELQV